MNETLATKLDTLQGALAKMGDVLVCFSGGVDSSFLLRIAHDVLGERACALTTVSPTNPDEDTAEAVALGRGLGVEHVLVHANELDVPGYRENPVNRCYFCKTNLYEIATGEASRRGISWIVDGVNLDDLGDYRPGLQAAGERSIRHPLADAALTKAEIRELSHAIGLRTWDRPASPCLSSRFPYGTTITLEALDRVARGEKVLHHHGFRECRVRYFGDRARIEVPAAELSRLAEPALRDEIFSAFEEIGFRSVVIDPRGFRSGRLNEAIDLHRPRESG